MFKWQVHNIEGRIIQGSKELPLGQYTQLELLDGDKVKVSICDKIENPYFFIRHFLDCDDFAMSRHEEYHIGFYNSGGKKIDFCYDPAFGEVRCSGEMIN